MKEDHTTILDDGGKLKAPAMLEKRGVLVILSSPGLGTSYVLDRSGILIGRHRNSDIVIADALISKEHCWVTMDGDGSFFIEDLHSTNQTILNNRPVRRRTRLHYGDRIVIGSTILRFFLEEKVVRREAPEKPSRRKPAKPADKSLKKPADRPAEQG